MKSLPDEAIDVHSAEAAHAPSALSLLYLYPIVLFIFAPAFSEDRGERMGA